MKRLHSQESGKSMVEMLGVLAIVGVLSVGGIAGYSQAMAKFKITKAMDQIQTIVTNIRTLYSSQRTFTNLDAPTAYKMGVLTDETFDSTDNEGVNPFGGRIIFGSAHGAGFNNSTFTVAYTKLDVESCIKLATAGWGADVSSGLYTISVFTSGADGALGTQGNNHSWAGNADTDSLPVTLAGAAAQCTSDSTGSTVLWEYR